MGSEIKCSHVGVDAAGYIRGELVVVAKVAGEERELFYVRGHRREHRHTCEQDMPVVIESGAF